MTPWPVAPSEAFEQMPEAPWDSNAPSRHPNKAKAKRRIRSKAVPKPNEEVQDQDPSEIF